VWCPGQNKRIAPRRLGGISENIARVAEAPSGIKREWHVCIPST
jgi:hypothetical protein